MKLIGRFKQTRFAALLKKTLLYEVYKRDQIRQGRLERAVRLSGNAGLAQGVVLDKVDVVITTKCNLLCSGCSHLMPYYQSPCHLVGCQCVLNTGNGIVSYEKKMDRMFASSAL